MREIKFRAWNKVFKEISNVLSIKFGAKSVFLENIGEGWERSKEYPLEDVFLMQYTGLKDKNGKEIYEGDIVKCDYYDEDSAGEPIHNSNTFVVKYSTVYQGFNTGEYPNGGEIEVIGNIYENPELLTRTK